MADIKKKFCIRFELSIGGLLGLCTVTFCIFLWMFLLGIWAGQTVLLPADGQPQVSPLSTVASLAKKGTDSPMQSSIPPAAPIPARIDAPAALDTGPIRPIAAEAEPPESGLAAPDHASSSFFSLQVASFLEAESANQNAADWQGRGYEVFVLPPENGDNGPFRVCIGKFEELAAANAEAGRLEDADEIKPYITLIPATGTAASSNRKREEGNGE